MPKVNKLIINAFRTLARRSQYTLQTNNVNKQHSITQTETFKMKNIVKVLAASVIAIAFTNASFAQATATASASATIITSISITKTVDMNFGNVAVSATLAGTVVLDA